MKQVSESVGAYYHHYPRIAVAVGAYHEGKNNAMIAGWHTPLSFNPPLFGVSLSPRRFTYKMIVESGEFTVNFLPASAAGLIAALGGSKGAAVDKFAAFNVARDIPLKTNAPVLADAYAAYECKLLEDRQFGDHQLLVGEVVAVHSLAEAFTAEETIDLKSITPAFYMGNDKYITKFKAAIETLERHKFGQPGVL
ncbi:flavin reductase family protein [Dehalogenimonas sp. THU2]|uniref:flavin reductase family protein n=1 Tax=Dehalogenimonas sp. THU2 TaxID=3151121 RepID=UPI00321857A9